MKKIYLSMMCMLVAFAGHAQEPTVSFNFTTACVGAPIVASIDMPEFTITSSAVAGNQQNGVMFDVVGVEGAIIKGFLIDVLQNNTNIELYYRPGSYVGFEDSGTGWTLIGNTTGLSMGTGVNAGIELALQILPGQTFGFYITTSDVNQFIEYATGTAVGTALATNDYITINSGVGKAYLFGTTYSPRDFVGSVLYEPVPTDITWSDNTSTGLTADYTASRTMGVIAKMTYGGLTHRGSGIFTVNEYDVNATATPAVLAWDESSTLSTEVTHITGLGTTFQAGNSQNGAMFDITATNGILINGFSVYPYVDGNTADIQIFYKTGTFVGSEGNAGAWTNIGSATGLTEGQDSYVALTSPLSVAPGQTMGIYITRTDDTFAYLNYTNGTGIGTVYASDANLSVKVGSGIEGSFSTVYANRMLNTVVHYEVENPTGLNYSWAPEGGTGGSAVVSPNADVTYTVTVDDGVCESTADVSVSMAVGIEEVLAESIAVYPNPATDNITIRAEQPMNVEYITLLDLNGKAVYQLVPTGAFTTATIPVADLATGMYLLQMNVDGTLTNRKVVVR